MLSVVHGFNTGKLIYLFSSLWYTVGDYIRFHCNVFSVLISGHLV